MRKADVTVALTVTTLEKTVYSPEPPAPRLELLETCWRFVGLSRRVFACEIYRTDIGLEVRAGVTVAERLLMT